MHHTFTNNSKQCKTTCIDYYHLNPANYLTFPGLAWDAMLLKTNINLELINDLQVLDIMERMKRGGLCFLGSKRHVVANNKYIENFPVSHFTYSAVQILKFFLFLAFIEIQRQLFHAFLLRFLRLHNVKRKRNETLSNWQVKLNNGPLHDSVGSVRASNLKARPDSWTVAYCLYASLERNSP